jgi:tetratricopeptide (TPR) repeat protein
MLGRGKRARELALAASRLIDSARAAQAEAMKRGKNDAAQAVAGLYRDAMTKLDESLRLDPGLAPAHRFRGVALLDEGELEAAAGEFETACRLEPDDAQSSLLLAGALQGLGRTAEAIARYRKLLARDPGHARAHASLALSLLGAGDYENGWPEYEWRLKLPADTIYRAYPFPFWRGEPLEGKSILICSEQGIGDEIMFASCYQEIIDRARECVIESSTRLVPLFERSFPRARILPRDLSRMPDWNALPRFDFHLPGGSLPSFLRRSVADFPRRRSYLLADAARVQYWRSRLEALGPGLKVGLAWTGGLAGTLRASRSLRLEDLQPLLQLEGVRFVSLEFVEPGRGPVWWREAARNVDESAALVAAVDLIISVTTTIAHVAGALGAPLWIAIPNAATWRYGWSGGSIPWYPHARIFRGGGDREALVTRLAEDLRSVIRTSAPRRD